LDPDIGGLVDRHHLALHLGYVGSSLLVANPRKSGKAVNGTLTTMSGPIGAAPAE
jgi:hypothetical protein